jgi:hypothetical protein
LRVRHRFHHRVAEEMSELIVAACTVLVHNAAVYGYRAGAAEERAHSLWLLADALALTPEDRGLPGRDDPEAAIRTLARRLARAKAGAGRFTGVRPVFGEFNSWYVSRVARQSCRAYRERHMGPER